MIDPPNAAAEEVPTGGPPSTQWVDKPDSPQVRAALVDKIGAQQRKLATGNPDLGGRIDRGQHQKQLLGAFGTLHIRDDVPAQAKYPPFAAPGDYKVACRFSNGQSSPFPDQSPDVRCVALKFFTNDGIETDLLITQEGGRSHARNAEQFMKAADILVDLQVRGGRVQAAKDLVRGLISLDYNPLETLRVGTILARETVLRRAESLATGRYWGSVVKLGDYAIKYSLQPHPTTLPGTNADQKDPDYLRHDLQNRLAQSSVRFQVCVQFFSDEKHTPVNNASVAWKAPLVPVGDLEIPTPPTTDDERLINSMAFNPGHGFEPLGITHARVDVYEASARNRGAATTDEIRHHFT